MPHCIHPPNQNCMYADHPWASLVAQLVKNPIAMQETWVSSLGLEDPLGKEKTTHSSIVAWRIPWPVWSMGLQRVRHDWATFTILLDHRPPTTAPVLAPYFFKVVPQLTERDSVLWATGLSKFPKKTETHISHTVRYFSPLNSASHLLNLFFLKHYLSFCPLQLDTELLSNMHNPSFPHHHHHSQLRYYQEGIITHWIFKIGMLQDNFKIQQNHNSHTSKKWTWSKLMNINQWGIEQRH